MNVSAGLGLLVLTLAGFAFVLVSTGEPNTQYVVNPFTTNYTSNTNAKNGEAAGLVGIPDCPDGIKEGVSYKPDGSCRNCTCYKTGRKSTRLTASCEECPTSPYYFDSTKCYSHFDNTLTFPLCCAPVVICRGQDGFDEALVNSGDQK